MAFHPLLAAFDFRLIFGIIVGLVWLLNWIFSGIKEAQQAQRKAAGRPAAPKPPPKPVQAAEQDEVKAFLRQAAEMRRRLQRQGQAPPVKPAPSKPPRPARRPSKPATLQPATQSVTSHVDQAISTESFSTRAAHMVDDIDRADRERQEHMSTVFEHKLGALGAASGPAAATQPAAQPSPAQTIAAALASPQDMRKFIILSEILQRPEQRWGEKK